MDSTIDFRLEVALVPLIAGGAKQLYRGCGSAVPHRAGNNEGCKEHGRDGRGQHRFDVAHAEGLVEALRRSSGDVENASNDSNDASGNVVGHDAARVEGIESFWSPRWLDCLQVTRDSIGITDPHARPEDPGEVKGPESEATKAGK